MNTIRAVLADDHAVVRSGIANALRDLSAIQIVDEVGDGQALERALAQHQPDLLLTDVTMPNFEPIVGVQHIRQRYPLLKILIVSAYADDVYVQGLLSVGVNGYHLKDQPLSDLRLAVQRVLAGERWICSPIVEKLLHYNEAVASGPALTPRQQDLLRHLQQGLDNQAIARHTGLSVKTVENHLTRLYRQLGVQSRLEAVNYLAQHPAAIRSGAPHPAEPPAPHAGLRILLVDDNMRYRTQMRKMIGKSYPHAQIDEADQISAAVALARRAQPQLAFVDVVLGDENGIECTRQLKAATPATRVVLISAYPDREFHRRGIESGAVAFLDKKDLDAAAIRLVIDDLGD